MGIKLLMAKNTPLGVIFRINCSNKLKPPTICSFEKQLLKEKQVPVPMFWIQDRNFTESPKASDFNDRFIYKNIAKCLNTVDAVTTSKDYKLAKNSFNSVISWFKMAYEDYFLKHWWIQYTIKEFNRKLAEAQYDRAMKR